MKLKTIFAAAALSVALISCGPKQQPLSEQLVGQWTGNDSITLTVKDSAGVDSTTSMTLPIELNYSGADSTFSAVLTVNDTTSVNFTGVVTFADSVANFTSDNFVCGGTTFNLSGTMKVANDVLQVVYNGVADGKTRDGKATLTRKVEEQPAAEQPAAETAADTTKKAE